VKECEQCAEPCAEDAKQCQWSGLFLCGECAYDEGIQAEDRYLELLELPGEESK
jgi:hypothetical protein